MVKTFTAATSGAQLFAGIMGTVDIGSMIANAIDFALDLKTAAAQFELLKATADYLASTSPSDAKTIATTDIETIIAKAPKNLGAYLVGIDEQIKSMVGASAGGFHATAAITGQLIKLMLQTGMIDLWTELTIGIPLQKTQEKAERYWNKQIAPSLPSERDFFMLYRLGYSSKTDYINRFREIDGLTSKDAEAITSMREWQVGIPSLRDAYLMVQKGLWTKDLFMSLANYGFGFTAETSEDLYKHFDYDFSPSELLRLSDLIPLESSWIEKKLKANGMNTSDIAVFKSAIEKRTIRDEINKIWSMLLDNYQWGLETEKSLSDRLKAWNFSNAEISIRLESANSIRIKLRLKLMRDAEIYLYRKGTITESELLERLTNLSIELSVANAITRNEAAKKGIEWELPLPSGVELE